MDKEEFKEMRKDLEEQPLYERTEEKAKEFLNEKIIGNLKKNPVFNMSLSGKEIFHSNVLAWLLESKDGNDKPSAISKELAKLFAPYKDGSCLDGYAVQEVLREKHNFDLLIIYKKASDFRFVVVENKFKSIPDAKQLKQYSEVIDGDQRYKRDGKYGKKGDVKTGKNYIDISNGLETGIKEKLEIKTENTTCYILAPNAALEVFDNSKSKEWKSVSYEEVLEKIESNNIEEQNKSILENYVDFTYRMLALSSDIAEISVNTPVYDFESIVENLRPVRIHDFYEKLWFSAVMHSIKGILSDDLKGIETVPGYSSRGGGILDFTYSTNEKPDICFGIQIQNKQFRVFVYPKNSDDKWKSEEEQKISTWLNSILGLEETKLRNFGQFKYLGS